MPVTVRPLGSVIETSSDFGLVNGVAPCSNGRSELPACRGKIAPLPTNATRPNSASCPRSASWSRSNITCAVAASPSRFRYNSA